MNGSKELEFVVVSAVCLETGKVVLGVYKPEDQMEMLMGAEPVI